MTINHTINHDSIACRAALAASLVMLLGGNAVLAGARAPEPRAEQQAEQRTQQSTTATREESVGVASGLAVGAAAAGPFGAVIGAAAGAWLGDRWGSERRAQQALQQATQRSDARLAGLTSVIHFRTDESALGPADAEALRRLGDWLVVEPQLRVRVCGYADSRGDAEYNLELSERRALRVAEALMAAGVDPARLQIEALGASGPVLDADGNSLRRRVTLVLERAPLTARN